MNYKKVILSLVVISLILIACSETKEKVIQPKTYEQVTQSTLAKTAGEIPKSGPGFDGKTIILGVITPQSGEAGFIGSALLAGNNTYWAAKNKVGGVAGKYKVKIVSEDVADGDTYNIENVISAYNNLNKEVVAFQHVYGYASLKSLEDKHLAYPQLIFPVSTSSSWVRNPLTVPIIAPDETQAIDAVGYFVESHPEIKKAKVCTLSVKDDEGAKIIKAVEFASSKYKIDYASQQEFETLDQIPTKVSEIKADNCDMVVFAATTDETKTYLDEIAKSSKKIASFGLFSTWKPQIDLTLSQKTKAYAGENFYIISPFAKWGANDIPGAAKMALDSYNFKPTQKPNNFFEYGYAQAWALDQILEVAVLNGDLSPEGIVRASSNIKKFTFDGLAPEYQYGPNKNTRIVPSQVNVYKYTSSDEMKMTIDTSLLNPVDNSNMAINYSSEFASKYVYDKK